MSKQPTFISDFDGYACELATFLHRVEASYI